jgi:hypothetical protein
VALGLERVYHQVPEPFSQRAAMNRICLTHAIMHSLLLSALLVGCTQQDMRPVAPAQISATPWPEADSLFYNNPDTPQWKGADVANSVALDKDRILWVFGDTLLSDPGANRCERFGNFDFFVHNSLALQQGSDPTTARIAHYWGQRDGKPDSFFSPRDDDGSWYWMGGLTVLENHVLDKQALVFLMRARSTVPVDPGSEPAGACAGLNFEMLGWDARIATITDETPDRWQWREVKLPADVQWQGILAGSSTAYVDDNYLYAWSAGPATLAGNPVYLARWPISAAAQGDLSQAQWHTATGWKTQDILGATPPRAIVEDGNNEISVGRNLWPGEDRSWWWLQSGQVVNSSLCYRNAQAPESFGKCLPLLQPPELARYPNSQLLVYAVKLHPELKSAGDDAVIATYVVNACSLQDIQNKCDLYYPRFIKLRLQR